MITIEGQIMDDFEPISNIGIPTINTKDCLYDAVTRSLYAHHVSLMWDHLALESHNTGARFLVKKSMSIDATLHEQKVRTYVPLNLGNGYPFDRLFLFLDRESMLRAFSRYNSWSSVKE
jgi:hypothetical protein